jgi:integrase/recombinase XerC
MTIIPADWAAAIDRYLGVQRAGGSPTQTLSTRRQHLQHLARHVGVGPWQMTSEILTGWCGEQTWAPSTRRSRRTTFQSFYRWAREEKLVKPDPAKNLPRVKPTPPKPRPTPEPVYLEALIRASDVETIWLELAADHGMRRGEIACVHSRDVFADLIGHSIVVHGKGNKDRIVPLTPRTARRLLELGEGYAFPGDESGHISARWLGKKINRLLPDAWTIHSLRHRFANRTVRAVGGDLFVTQELLGHASPATTRMYVEVDRTQMRVALLAAAAH